MNVSKRNEELLREASSLGDEEGVKRLIDNGTNVNAQHSLNGWTALHWAAKRGYPSIVKYLLASGADPSLKSLYGESASAVAKDDDIRRLFSEGSDVATESKNANPLPITPNYLANPVLTEKVEQLEHRSSQVHFLKNEMPNKDCAQSVEELVLKVRTSNPPDQDFIEVEIPMSHLSYENVVKICCEELRISPQNVIRLRKLPNTIVRKDKDVYRFQNFQELELVTKETYRPQIDNYSNSSIKVGCNGFMNNNTNISQSPLVSKSYYCKNGEILY